MEEPIMTTAGISYEKKILFQHFSSNGYYEPITRADVNQQPLMINTSLKKVINNYK